MESWLHSLKVAQLLRSAACLHTNQSRSYLNHLVFLLDRNLTPWNKRPFWEASICSDCIEIPRNLWKPKVHSRFHKSQRLFPNVNQMNRVHPPPPFKIHSNELRSTVRSSNWSVYFSFSSRDIAYTSLLA